MGGNLIHKQMWMEHVDIRKDYECKCQKECDEWQRTAVKDILLLHTVTQLGVESSESNSGGKVDVGLDEWDHFSSGLFRSYHEHVLRVTKDGVIKEDEEEHGT